MAILVLWASPNADGLTVNAKDRVVAGLQAAGAEVEELNISRKNIKRCLACGDSWGNCRAKGECILPDDFQSIYDQMLASEGIVFVTPVYYHDLPESLRCFLDRLRRCEAAHNHLLEGKTCLLVACAGGSGRGACQSLERLEEILNYIKVVPVDRLPVIQFNKGYLLPALEGAGKQFALSLRGE